MKCKDCECAEKGWFVSQPDKYACIGVKEPFIIEDINVECTEYSDKRHMETKGEPVVMNTAEMWLKAQHNGKIYEVVDGDIAYSKKYGLTDKYDFSFGWSLEAWEEDNERGLDRLLSLEWREMDNVMSVKEAESRFGIKIVTK